MATISAPAVAPRPIPGGTATGQDPVLHVDDLRIYFETPRGLARVVDGASFSVHRNEIFGIAGESGCGKTTLVEAILQIIRFPNRKASGRVLFFPEGKKPVDLMQLSPRGMRRMRWEHLSYVPQGSMNSLNPVMRVGQQLIDGMTAHGVSDGQAKRTVPQLLEKVGLDPRVERLYPHELSGGMKQRVIIAAAIAMDPDLIIADEPTTALDVNVQRVILETLAHLRSELGVAILTVSHDLPVHAQLVGPDRRHVRRSNCRDWRRAPRSPGPAPSVYPGPHGLDSGHRRRTAAPERHRRRHAQPPRLAGRLPLPPPLPAGDGALLPGGADPGAHRRG